MNDPKPLTLTLTTAQAQMMLNALAARPYAEVSGVIQDFLNQIQAQQSKEESK